MDDILVSIGGAVKSLGNGKFEAPLVTFGGADLSNEFFTKTTDFWVDFPSRLPLLYHHGQDTKIGKQRLGDGRATVKSDDAGVWMEGQLNLANEYERAISDLIDAGKMGTSSGSASHLVERKREGKSVEIITWPLVEASLTPTPCEPRNRVMSLKSFMASAEDNEDFEDLSSGIEAVKTERDLEKFLRDSGASRAQAVAITAKFWKLMQRDSATDDQRKEDESLSIAPGVMKAYFEREARLSALGVR